MQLNLTHKQLLLPTFMETILVAFTIPSIIDDAVEVITSMKKCLYIGYNLLRSVKTANDILLVWSAIFRMMIQLTLYCLTCRRWYVYLKNWY